jgi:peroxidase
MKQVYGSVDKVDLWTGGLAEKSASGAMVGQTFRTIIGEQFERLRDGDRFYFENALDKNAVQAVKSTTLSDIIERNSDTPDLQEDVFVFAARRTSLAPGEAAEHLGAPQLVIGSAGVDTLVGGPKADTLVAAAGIQTLTGKAGADTFRFHGEQNRATITDFVPGIDHLQFEGDGKPRFAAGTGGDTVVTFDDTSVLLKGIPFHGNHAEFQI